MPSRSADRWLEIPSTSLHDFPSSFPHYAREARPPLPVEKWQLYLGARGSCRAIVESGCVKRQTESCTGTVIEAERLRVSMGLCECFCETVSVWGRAEWETSILLWTYWCFSQPIFSERSARLLTVFFHRAAQASLPYHSFFFLLHHFVALGCLGSLDYLLQIFMSCSWSHQKGRYC